MTNLVAFAMRAEACSQIARSVSLKALKLERGFAERRQMSEAHRRAVFAHAKANLAWVNAHAEAVREDTQPEARRTYDKYVRHFDRVKFHYTKAVEFGTRHGLSFPGGGPVARSKDYLLG